MPVATFAMLTVADTAVGLTPDDSRMLDEVGPKPMPSAPSTNAAANPAMPTTTRSFMLVNPTHLVWITVNLASVPHRDPRAAMVIVRRRSLRSAHDARSPVTPRSSPSCWRPRVEVQTQAYAPYSHFLVGAAIRTRSGRVFSGCNVENAAYPQGTCAEAGAIAAMVAAGERAIEVVVTVCDGEMLSTPCGGCRQKIREFADASTAHPRRRAGGRAGHLHDG